MTFLLFNLNTYLQSRYYTSKLLAFTYYNLGSNIYYFDKK